MPGADEPVIDFSGYVAERTEGFGGRDWIVLAIDEWLADPAGGPIFLLTGEPGAGKSALAGRLALISSGAVPAPDGAGSLRAGFLAAVHFCSARDLRWITPSVFAKSLARQLSERYASYALALLQDTAPRINVRQEVGQNWGRMVAVEINTLEVNAGHHEDLFDRIVRGPLEALARDQLTAPVTILVDALDESLASRERPTIAELVANAEGLPETVRFIVTCRPRGELIRSLQRRSRRQYTLSPRPADDGGPPDEYSLVLRDVQDHVERMLRDQALSGRLAAGLAPAQDDDRFPAAAAAVAAQLTADPLPSSQPRAADPPSGPSPLADITARIRIGDAAECAAFAAAFAAAKRPDPGGRLAAEVAAIGRAPSSYYQAARLSELAQRLPADLLPAALTVAENIADDDARARAMHGLAPRLPEDLLRRVVSVIGPQSRGVSFTLAPVARYLPEPLLREAFTRVSRIESASERTGVMAALADYLPEPLAAQAMEIVRQAARGRRQSPETQGLARLAMHLPDAAAAEFSGLPFEYDSGRVDSLPDLLRALRWAASVASWEGVAELAGRAIAQAKSAIAGRSYASWNLRYRIKLLIELLPHLPEPSLAETAAAAAIRLIVDESAEELPPDQVATLGAYLPRALLPEAVSPLIAGLPRYLPDGLLAAALEAARAKKSVPWLFALTPRLDPVVLPETLRVAREFGGAGLQAQLLGDCAQAFAGLPPEVLYAAWRDTLRGMANLNRAEFLRHLGSCGPVVAALGGPDAVAVARQAVDEIARWWP